MINHVGCVCRPVRASRCGSVPSNLVLPGGLAWVAEMAWRIWCCKAAIATIHQLFMCHGLRSASPVLMQHEQHDRGEAAC
ncbi:hypothetical protein J3F84DRAFT_360113 [Trichoderma pleuroticola]